MNPKRSSVELALDEQATALARIVDLIDRHMPWTDWDKSDRGILAAAVDEGSCSGRVEQAKARSLRRHLFRSSPLEIESHASGRPDLAGPVRAELAGLVPLGAGRHIAIDAENPSPMALR